MCGNMYFSHDLQNRTVFKQKKVQKGKKVKKAKGTPSGSMKNRSGYAVFQITSNASKRLRAAK